MGIKYDISQSYLKREYIKNNRTMNSIAKEIGCHKSTVRNYLEKYKIKRNYSLAGQTFTRLIVIKRFDGIKGKYKGQRMWECQCACGNETILSTHELKSGNTKSCGCWIRVNRNNYKNWKGYKEITGKWWGGIKRGAIKRSHKFKISIKYAWNLFVSIELALTNRHRATASLDRIDNTRGYINGNVQWVHKDVNYMKQKFEQEYFIKLCKKIAWKNN